ncbi:MAG: hypothetical protein M0R03_10930 [Novosphingobium sp.]|nr:hypothetical protein [Novosphingobium sp.]
MSQIICFDIETCPKVLSEQEEQLLESKLRNYEKDSKEYSNKKTNLIYGNPLYNQVVAISTLMSNSPQTPIESTHYGVFFNKQDEESLIKDFINYISQFPYAKYVHFNGLDFDVPILLAKCAMYAVTPPARFCNTIRFRTDPHYDIMQVFSNWGRFYVNLRELLIRFCISDSKSYLNNLDRIDFMVQASDDDIKKYSIEDVKSTYLLFQKIFRIYQ